MRASSFGIIHTNDVRKNSRKHDISETIANETVTTENKHSYMRPIILGAIDGLITSFVIIASGFAGNIEKKNVVIIGFSSLFADAFSMGTSEFLSVRGNLSLRKSIVSGLWCLLSFALCGSLPLIAYVFSTSVSMQITLSVIIFEIILLLIAFFKTKIFKENILHNIVEIILLGSFTGGISAMIAYTLK